MNRTVFQTFSQLLLCGCLIAGDLQDNYQNPDFTAETLNRAGIMQSSDIFSILDGWQAYTVDGYTWTATPWGSPLTQTEPYTLLVNGSRINSGLLGFQALNMLPIAQTRVSSVELGTEPQFADGRISSSGFLNYRTKPIPPDLTLRGSFHIGNETGDPGPFRYTEFNSINVDKIGPDMSASLTYGGTAWEIESDVGFQQYFPTDEKIIERIHQAAPDSPKIKALTNALTIRQKGGSWHHELNWYAALSENYLYFVPAYQEVRTRHRAEQLQWRVSHPLSDNTKLKVKTTLVRKSLLKQKNIPDLDFDLDQTAVGFFGEVEQTETFFTNTYGVRMQARRTRSGYLPGKLNTVWINYFQNLSYQITPSLRQKIQLTVQSGDGLLTGSVKLATRAALSDNHTLALTLSYLGELPGENDEYSYYLEKGYSLLQENGWDYALVGALKSSRKFLADIRWLVHSSENWNAEIDVRAGWFRDMYLESRTVHFDSTAFVLNGTVTGSNSGSYETLVTSVRLNYILTRNLTGALYAGYTDDISGDEVSRAYFSAVPSWKLSSKTLYVYGKHLSLWILAAYQSRTYWPEYAALEAESGGFYNAHLPAQVSLDVAVEKQFWNRRLIANFVLRNTLNRELMTFPVGSVQHLSLFVKVSISLP